MECHMHFIAAVTVLRELGFYGEYIGKEKKSNTFLKYCPGYTFTDSATREIEAAGNQMHLATWFFMPKGCL